MRTKSLTVDGLRASELRAVEEEASKSGTSPAAYVRELIKRDVLSRQSFDAILRPVRADVETRGLTEDDVDRIARQAKRRSAKRRQVRR